MTDWPFHRVEGDLSYGITQEALDGAAAAAAGAVEGVEVASRRFARPRGRGAHVEVAGVGYKPLYDPENLKPRS